jgi:DNA-binding winged helix-turn-helix (wHTH) protein/alpha-beta hydrolase superfamily lysophospholipase
VIYAFDDYELDSATFELRQAGVLCPLEPQVFEVLRYLVEHHDRMVPKDELLDHVWPERYITEAALSSRLMAARKAIGDSGKEQRLIRTLHGRGFRFVGDVRVSDGQAAAEPVASGAAPAIIAATDPVAMPVTAEVPFAFDTPAPPVRYAVTPNGEVHIAYASIGAGLPLIRVPGWFTHLDYEWRWPRVRRLWELLAEDFTLIRYDARGVGLSDPADHTSVDTRLADLEAVIESLGLEQFALLGTSPGGTNTAVRYTALHPGRVTHLICHGGGANVLSQDEHEAWIRQWEMHLEVIQHGWGSDLPIYRRLIAELLLGNTSNTEDVDFLAELHALAAPADRAYQLIVRSVDNELQELASMVRTPTLLTHAIDDPAVPLSRARRLAALIPGARLAVLDGASHWLLANDGEVPPFVRAVRTFFEAE